MKRQDFCAYAVINTDEAVRMQSTSGGVFTMLAESVLAQGGVVFGAAVTQEMYVAHIKVETAEQLWRLRGSKYVRSHLGNSYQCVKAALEAGRPVLFSGTPCQVGGLRAYLKEDYDNLLCVDVICHGAPKNSVWEQYVRFRERKAGAKATAVNFRDKSDSWQNYHLMMTFENGKVYRESVYEDPYMKAFLQDLTLGASCYSCAFKGMQHKADITLGDFWGVAELIPQMYDDRGTSLVFVNTEKGMKVFACLEGLQIAPADAQVAIARNPAMVCSAKRPESRERFLAALETDDFEKVVKLFCPQPSLCRRLIRKAKRLVRKLAGR